MCQNLVGFISRSKPEICLWMTASIIGCIGLQSVKYERLHSLLWGVFHNWTKPWSFINLWRKSSIFGGLQQIWQQNIWSATDWCLQLNQNGSLCFVKIVRNELHYRQGQNSHHMDPICLKLICEGNIWDAKFYKQYFIFLHNTIC